MPQHPGKMSQVKMGRKHNPHSAPSGNADPGVMKAGQSNFPRATAEQAAKLALGQRQLTPVKGKGGGKPKGRKR